MHCKCGNALGNLNDFTQSYLNDTKEHKKEATDLGVTMQDNLSPGKHINNGDKNATECNDIF